MTRLAKTILVLLLASWWLVDGFQHLLIQPPHYNARILVVDPENLLKDYRMPGVRVLDGVGVEELRVLGASDPQVIVFLGHSYTLHETLCLEARRSTSLLDPLQHPLLAVTHAIVRGVDGGEALAFCPQLLHFSRSLEGKRIVIISCSQQGVGKLVEALLEAGALEVAVYTSMPDPEHARSLALEALKTLAATGTLDHLAHLGFTVHHGDGARRLQDYGPPTLLAYTATIATLLATHLRRLSQHKTKPPRQQTA